MRSMPKRQASIQSPRLIIVSLALVMVTIFLSLSACSESRAPVSISAPSVAATATLTPEMPSPQPVENTSEPIEPASTATDKPSCSKTRGNVARSYINTRELPGRLNYTVYIPPCYTTDEEYPTLYLLHGKSSQDDQWIRLGLPEIMDNMINSGELPPFIVVMPYDPGWEDPNTGKYDKAIGEELVPWINERFSVRNDRAYRAIGGLSRGSGWAFHTVLRYPNLFSIIGIHSPAFFRADRRQMETLLAELAGKKYTRFILDVGNLDPELNYATRFEGFLTQFGIDHSWTPMEGAHTEAYWRQNLALYLAQYAQDW